MRATTTWRLAAVTRPAPPYGFANTILSLALTAACLGLAFCG